MDIYQFAQPDPTFGCAPPAPIGKYVGSRCGMCGNQGTFLDEFNRPKCMTCSAIEVNGTWRKHAGPAHVEPEVPFSPVMNIPDPRPSKYAPRKVISTYTCERCGTIGQGQQNRMYCEPCQKLNKIESKRRWTARKAAKEGRTYEPKLWLRKEGT